MFSEVCRAYTNQIPILFSSCIVVVTAQSDCEKYNICAIVDSQCKCFNALKVSFELETTLVTLFAKWDTQRFKSIREFTQLMRSQLS